MYKTLNYIGKIICIAIIILGAVFGILIISKGADVQTSAALQDRLVSPAMVIAYVALLIALVTMFILPFFFAKYTKKTVIRGLIIIGIVGLLLLVCYMLPTVQLRPEFIERMGVTDKVSKRVDVGIYVTFIVFVAAVVTIIYAAVSNFIKNR